ncbi:MAG: hypothetical protein CMH26_01690 [Micavibrio sp.]|nr:hypothetical protein [Micavibrio sp.]
MIKYLKFAVLGTAVAVAGFSGSEAQAANYSCATTVQDYAASYSTYSTCAGTGNQASTISTSTAVLATAAASSAKLVSGRVASAMSGVGGVKVAANGFSASTGKAAGGYEGKIGTWVSGSWSDVEDENTDTAFDGDVFSVMGGVDYKVTSKTIVGLAFGYEDTDLDTGFNGFGGTDGSLEGKGYTIAPYIGAQIAPDVTANLTVGYSDLEYDTTRYDQFLGNAITGSTDADRYFVNAGVNGSYMYDANWHVRGTASVLYAHEEKDGYTETETNGNTIVNSDRDNDFGQVALEAKLGYVFDQMIEPYALVGVAYDFAKDDSPIAAGQSRSALEDEDFSAKFGGGVDFDLGSNVTAGIEGYTVEFLDDYNEYTVTGGLRVEF